MKPVILLTIILIISQSTTAKKTIFSGHFDRKAEPDISLQYYPDALAAVEGTKVLHETNLDGDKNFSISFELEYPVMINVMNGKDWLFYNIFICPGDSIYMVFTDSTMEINGRGEKQMAFMFDHAVKFLTDKEVNKEFSSSYVRLNALEYAQYWDKRKNDQLDYFNDYFKDTIVNEEFKRVFEYEVLYDYGLRYAQYAWRRKKDHRFLFKIPGYLEYLDKIKVNNEDALISDRYILFLRELPYGMYVSNTDRSDNPDETGRYFAENPLRLRDSITKVYFTGKAYDIALYNLLYEQVSNLNNMKGTAYFDSFFTIVSTDVKQYGKGFNSDTLLTRLERKLAEMKKSNEPAPDFTAYNIDGKEVKLSDYKGKVVYADFWATNCAPCIAELPATKKLQERFKDNKDVVFLYIAFDSPESRAKKFIADKDFTGTHWFLPKGFASDAAKKYHIEGIPRYILVDKEGLLVSDDALRPGDHPDDLIDNALMR